ncbi:MAG: SAM-dependent methyltransferase [Flammeovirgaceae bacterium]|jgi:SAM-dependent methyltransferase
MTKEQQDTEKSEWFGTWFDSPYYHKLYKHRDTTEAGIFIKNLAGFLKIQPEHKIMDLACGKGRHSIFLNKLGLDVVGLDLSEQSIAHAQQFENERLCFAVHDMRDIYRLDYFDFVLNMFTSFGYFQTEVEHITAIQAVCASLKKGGKFVLDFFNTNKVVDSLVYKNQTKSEGIVFEQKREIIDGSIVKTINFEHEDEKFEFQERVKAFTEADFRRLFKLAQLDCIHVFGDYELNPFDASKSERMIFVVEKSI